MNPKSATLTRQPTPDDQEPFFGVNEIRLTPRQWLVALVITAIILVFTPLAWERRQNFKTGPDYRIPYALSNDYWLFGRRVDQVVGQNKVILIGDSVIWGEYVAPDGSLSHFFNQQPGQNDRFVNLGVNGLFPLAQEGLIQYFGQSLRREKIIIQFNPLWLTSPQADLSAQKIQRFNHASLVPQIWQSIPCYRATPEDRLSIVVQRKFTFLQWVEHLQYACFDGKNIPRWTLADNGKNPPQYPNAYRNPLSQITLNVPSAPANDPDRGQASSRHKPWSAEGKTQTRFQWVPLDDSVQWHAFQRMVDELQSRGNSVFVLVGPFNEHLMTDENRESYEKIRAQIGDWLKQNRIPYATPDALPSELYADASHPLTEGYRQLAKLIFDDSQFQNWNK